MFFQEVLNLGKVGVEDEVKMVRDVRTVRFNNVKKFVKRKHEDTETRETNLIKSS